MTLAKRIAGIVARVKALKPTRVFIQFIDQRGPLLASGLSYQGIFAVFAGLWVSFSVAGIVVQSTPELRDALFATINTSVPGLIDNGNGNGAISREDLLSTGALTWTGGIALVGLLVTALGWLTSGRNAVRTMFDLPGDTVNFFLLKARDLGLAIGFGITLLVSASLSVGTTAALGLILDAAGADESSVAATISARAVGLLLAFVIDLVTLAVFYRIVASVPIPFRQLAAGSLLGAVALGALKALGSLLLAAATRNPLLAGFAAIVGLLIWFNLICQVILLCSSWIAVSLQDEGVQLARPPESERPKRKPIGRPKLRSSS